MKSSTIAKITEENGLVFAGLAVYFIITSTAGSFIFLNWSGATNAIRSVMGGSAAAGFAIAAVFLLFLNIVLVGFMVQSYPNDLPDLIA